MINLFYNIFKNKNQSLNKSPIDYNLASNLEMIMIQNLNHAHNYSLTFFLNNSFKCLEIFFHFDHPLFYLY